MNYDGVTDEIAKGLIELAPDLEDNRIKYVQATGRTEEYFALLGRCMAEAQH